MSVWILSNTLLTHSSSSPTTLDNLFHHAGQGGIQGLLDLCLCRHRVGVTLDGGQGGAHESLGGPSFANQGGVGQFELKAVGCAYVIDRLGATFEQDKNAVGPHALNGVGGKQNDFALGGLGDGGDVFAHEGRFKCGILYFGQVQVQAQTLEARVVRVRVGAFDKGQHFHERGQIFFGQGFVRVKGCVSPKLLLIPCGRQQGDGPKDIAIGPGHDGAVLILQCLTQDRGGGTLAGTGQPHQDDHVVLMIVAHVMENDLCHVRGCLTEYINTDVGFWYKGRVNDTLFLGEFNAQSQLGLVFGVTLSNQVTFLLCQFGKAG